MQYKELKESINDLSKQLKALIKKSKDIHLGALPEFNSSEDAQALYSLIKDILKDLSDQTLQLAMVKNQVGNQIKNLRINEAKLPNKSRAKHLKLTGTAKDQIDLLKQEIKSLESKEEPEKK
jgi:archaellum component FlaC